jgi:hypothetical protein
MVQADVYVLLDNKNLSEVKQITARVNKWQTRVQEGRRSYQNVIYEAHDVEQGRNVVVVCGIWSENTSWDVRLNIPLEQLVVIDVEQGLLAFKDGDVINVTNGFQQIIGINKKPIPHNQPKALKEFALQVLETQDQDG